MSSRFGRNKKRKLIADHYAITGKLAQIIARQEWENRSLAKDLDAVRTRLNDIVQRPSASTFHRSFDSRGGLRHVTIHIPPMQMDIQGDISPRKAQAFAAEFSSKVHEVFMNEVKQFINVIDGNDYN